MKTIYIAVSTALLFWMCDFAAAGVFTDNGNGTVTDTPTTLMWQKQDDGITKTWEQALTYCEGLSLGGFSDWRLPNIKELRSIIDSSKYSPAINTTYFPNTQSSYYWSSTTYAGGTTDAWYVYFDGGHVDNFSKTLTATNKITTHYVRCVRAGQ